MGLGVNFACDGLSSASGTNLQLPQAATLIKEPDIVLEHPQTWNKREQYQNKEKYKSC